MFDSFLFIGLPYLSVFVLIVGSLYRHRNNPFSASALSSQFLESRTLLWGSVPWHLGITLLFVGHLVPVCFPKTWKTLTALPFFLASVESLGIFAALLSVGGLVVMILRRFTAAKLRVVTTTMDVMVLTLLLLQVLLGLITAIHYRWGAVWSLETTTRYLWSLASLQPDISSIKALPLIVRLHITGAWLLLLLIPFSRLIHIFSLPLGFFFRPPQKVVWNNTRQAYRGEKI